MILINVGVWRYFNGGPLKIKVVGHAGKKLKIYSYLVYSENQAIQLFESITGLPSYHEEHDITSDEFEVEYPVIPYCPPDTRAYLVIARVETNAGDVIETNHTIVLYATRYDTFTAPSDTEVWVFINGLTYLKYTYRAGENVSIPKANGLVVIVWYEGRLMVYQNGEKIHDVSGRYAIVRIQYKVPRQYARSLTRFIDDPEIADVVYKAPEIADAVGAVAFLRHTIEEHKWDIMVEEVRADDNYLYLTVKMLADIGTPIDWSWITKLGVVLAGGGLIVAGVLTANPVLVALGTGIVIGSVTSIVVDQAFEKNPEQLMREADVTIRRFEENASRWEGELDSYLEQLVREGKITREDKERIMSYFRKVREEARKAMEKLKTVVKEAYSKGYRDGVREQQKWIAVAGVAGFVIGYAIAR